MKQTLIYLPNNMFNSKTSAAGTSFPLQVLAALAFISAWLFSGEPVFSGERGTRWCAQGGPHRDSADDFGLLFGWPRVLQGESTIWGICPAVLDFDGNVDWEIALLNAEGMLFVFQNDGAHFPGYPLRSHRPQLWTNPRHNATIAVGDLTQDGDNDIVYISDLGFLHLVDSENGEIEPFPVDLGRSVDCGVPAIADVNRDGALEIVFNSWSTLPDSVEADARLNIYGSDGTQIEGWPVVYHRGSSSSPVVGDIDGGEGVEIVVGNARYLDQPAQIYAWFEDGRRVPGFPVGSFQTIHSAPTLVNLDGRRGQEILLWAADMGGSAGIYAYRGDGSLLDGFPLDCPTGHPEGNPIAADITGDSIPELIFGTYNPIEGGSIYAWTSAGETLEGYPIHLNRSVIGTVLAADVSGDGVNDVVAALSPGNDLSSVIVAYDCHGEVVPNFPIELEGYGGGSFAWTPTLWDVDQDRDIDLIAVTTDRRMLIWGTPGRTSEYSWPTFKGNMRRDGRCVVGEPNRVQPADSAPMPAETRIDAWPNPFNNRTNVTLSLPRRASGRLVLVDCEGRVVLTVASGALAAGANEFTLDCGGAGISAGVYFLRFVSRDCSAALRALYLP